MLRRKAIGVDPLNPGSSGILNSNDRSGVIVDHGIPTKVGVSSANSNDLPAMATIADERNKDVLVWVGDRLLPRELAKVVRSIDIYLPSKVVTILSKYLVCF